MQSCAFSEFHCSPVLVAIRLMKAYCKLAEMSVSFFKYFTTVEQRISSADHRLSEQKPWIKWMKHLSWRAECFVLLMNELIINFDLITCLLVKILFIAHLSSKSYGIPFSNTMHCNHLAQQCHKITQEALIYWNGLYFRDCDLSHYAAFTVTAKYHIVFPLILESTLDA